jgi:LEA14-like dessication related protein
MNMQKPIAAISGMSVGDVNASGFTLNFGVDVKNPNSKELPLKAANYQLSLAGTKILDGKAKPEGSIPANGSKQINVPVTMTYENLLTAKDAIIKRGGNLSYALEGGLSFDAGGMFGSMNVPLKYSGDLPVKDLLKNPMALLRSPAALKLAKALMGGVAQE